MSVISIGYSKSTQNTKAFALVVEGWNELVQDGLTPDHLSFPLGAEDSEVLYASRGGEMVGCILWRHAVEAQTFHVTLAYVEISSRKKGVFKEMLGSLKKLAQQRQVTRIAFEIGAGNEFAGTVLEAVGAHPSLLIYDM